ncbi:uncharacterized protein MYCGRDRAFT_80816 [Zymoseptoria tritici IPO323]|uniref:Uncharacterized protein n=1 Tax=Zymoseptoria tritici (strain CBS 115943 / IPO323) TaxID=336722 RepID=F9XC93_ZYMTI|nr:uncharacterized protein MYCGRDRAFT_80816 [Zymoseptoria tritici IPO323]EGP87168.1 hypothetical protein MYCGRDRAFT_80816 [Zymoseptoria tritici IPO323]
MSPNFGPRATILHSQATIRQTRLVPSEFFPFTETAPLAQRAKRPRGRKYSIKSMSDVQSET